MSDEKATMKLKELLEPKNLPEDAVITSKPEDEKTCFRITPPEKC